MGSRISSGAISLASSSGGMSPNRSTFTAIRRGQCCPRGPALARGGHARFFRSAPFSGATVIAVCAFAALGGFLFLNTSYLQDVRGYSALHAGLFMLPMAAMVVMCAPLSGRILAARGPRLPLVVAGLAFMASGAMLTRLATGTPASWLIACYLALGVGTGMVNPAITNTAVSGIPHRRRGSRPRSPRPAARSAPRSASR